jgi:hypothetical protein
MHAAQGAAALVPRDVPLPEVGREAVLGELPLAEATREQPARIECGLEFDQEATEAKLLGRSWQVQRGFNALSRPVGARGQE